VNVQNMGCKKNSLSVCVHPHVKAQSTGLCPYSGMAISPSTISISACTQSALGDDKNTPPK